jgi:hypothetical protein
MATDSQKRRRLAPLWRAIIEIGFIIFLFYSNLLMGEFESANERGKSLLFGLHDILTPKNFLIAISSALVGYIGFESLRKKL